MNPRIDITKTGTKAVQALLHTQQFVNHCGIEYSVLEFVKMRASQINGCAYCLDMHSKDMRAAGESEQRIHLLPAWREVPFYSERERAALEWTEALTLLTEGHAPDDVYQRVRAQFSEEEIVNLTLAVAAINSWNRLCVSLRVPAGTYQPKAQARAANA
jgi:AhpD family alkylhydroperoxidase